MCSETSQERIQSDPELAASKVERERERESSLDSFFYSTLLRDLSNKIFLRSKNICALYQVAPKMFFIILLVQGCKFLLPPQCHHFIRENNEQRLKLNCILMKEKQLVDCQNYCRKKQVDSIYLSISKDNCFFGTFISPNYTFSLAGNIFIYTPSQGTNREKYFYKMQHQRLKCRFWCEINTFPSISSFIGRVLSIRRKMDGPNSSQLDIKVLKRAPTLYIQV